MNGRARRNVPQRQRVPNQNVSLGSTDNFLPNLQSVGLHDVALLAVRIAQQCNARGAAWIVLNRDPRRWNAVLVALEVNCAQLALVAASDEAHGRVARVAASA